MLLLNYNLRTVCTQLKQTEHSSAFLSIIVLFILILFSLVDKLSCIFGPRVCLSSKNKIIDFRPPEPAKAERIGLPECIASINVQQNSSGVHEVCMDKFSHQ